MLLLFWHHLGCTSFVSPLKVCPSVWRVVCLTIQYELLLAPRGVPFKGGVKCRAVLNERFLLPDSDPAWQTCRSVSGPGQPFLRSMTCHSQVVCEKVSLTTARAGAAAVHCVRSRSSIQNSHAVIACREAVRAAARLACRTSSAPWQCPLL